MDVGLGESADSSLSTNTSTQQFGTQWNADAFWTIHLHTSVCVNDLLILASCGLGNFRKNTREKLLRTPDEADRR